MKEEQLIQKGFNHGYQLEKSNPKLADSLSQGMKDRTHPYTQGFTAGREEYSKERALENYNPPLPSKGKGKDLDKGMEI
jgi:hypothetical protein